MSKTNSENNVSPSNEKRSKKRSWWKRALRFGVRFLAVLIIVLILLILFIRSPWGQDIITSKLTDYVSGKTHTEVRIKKLFVTFSGKLDVEGLYLEDQRGDTLVYSKTLKAAIPVWPIIKGEPISINRVTWDGLRANVNRQDSVSGFNFQFLIDAFASDTTSTPTDTTDSAPPDIAVGRIDFSDFQLHYDDEVSGMNARIKLGHLHFQGKNFDLEKMRFEVAELGLKNTDLSYEQTKTLLPDKEEDTTSSPLPFLSVDQLTLHNIDLHYQSKPDSLSANISLGDFMVQVPKADLSDQTVDVGMLTLMNSSINLTLPQEDSHTEDKNKSSEKTHGASEGFSWPKWEVKVAGIDFENNDVHYQKGPDTAPTNYFNPDNIAIKDLLLKADNILLSREEQFKLTLDKLAFKEGHEFTLNKLAFAFDLNAKKTQISNFNLKTGHNQVKANLKTQYASIDDLVNHPDQSDFSVALYKFSLNLTDAFYFQPDLKHNTYVKKISQKPIHGHLKAKGNLEKMNLPSFSVKWGATTQVITHGMFEDVTDPDKLSVAIKQFRFHTTRDDITSFIPEDTLGISVPTDIQLTSRVDGQLDNIKTTTELFLPKGHLSLKGHYKNTDELTFNGHVAVDSLNLGEILQNPEIGPLAFKLEAEGHGNSLEDLSGKLSSKFSQLNYNNYDYSALKLNGKMNKGHGNLSLNYKDNNLNLNLDSKIDLDSVAKKVALDLNLNGVDLYALGWSDQKIKAKMLMTAHLRSEDDNLDFSSHIDQGTAVYQKKTYHLGKVDLKGLLHQDSTAMNIQSNFLNASLASNTNTDSLSKSLGRHFKRYFYDTIPAAGTIAHPVKLKMKADFTSNELLTELFFPEVQSMDTLKLRADYDESKSLLASEMSLPYLNYDEKIIDSLQFKLDASKDAGHFKFGFNQIDAGAFLINPTFFEGDLKNGTLTLDFESLDEDGHQFYASRTEITGKNKVINIHVVPDKLIVKGEPWSTPEDNKLELHPKKIVADNFNFSHQSQRLQIANDLIKVKKKNIGIGFDNFKLASFMALFNADEYLAKGNLQGDIVVVSPLEKMGFLADFGIDSLQVLKAPLGDLSLKAKTNKEDQYLFKMRLKGDDVDLSAQGRYAAEDPASFKFDLDLDKFGFKTISKLAGDQLHDGAGYLSGKINAEGPVKSPDYNGHFQFHEAHFEVAQLNETFYLTEDRINLNKEGLQFDNFSIDDQNHNSFTLDGTLITKPITNPKFDFTLKAKNFEPMNSSEKDNEDYYGTINFDLDGTIKGSANLPKVDLDIGINKETDFTYVMSESQADLEKREGIVEFVNKTNPDAILTRHNDSSNVAKIKGMQLHARLNIDKEASFGVIVDPRNGDNLKISGEAGLDFRIARNGHMSLSGRYTISGGHYKMSLYNLVKREFEFKPGGTIDWHGDPMDADLDVTAEYKIKTSASGLMASQISGASAEEKNKYKQVLPFLVDLNVKGTIDRPDLIFSLDMPEGEKGAIGGSVYSRINQLNEEDQGELNKQVFSLLVLNRFYPESGSDGSQGGVASMARNNLNQALSDQLNNFSNKLMGDTGIQLNFGLDSYTDYQGKSAQDRTDLNVSAQKKLFNDRLVVKAGTEFNVEGDRRPGEENTALGNVSIEYLLTKDGRWRIRGFRKNEYENVIDGQVFINGISLLFQRQFNTLHELYTSFFSHPDKKDRKKRTKSPKESAGEQKEHQSDSSSKEPEKQND